MLVPGSSPANGFATCCVRKLLVASSRTGDVEKYCPGTEFSSRVTGMFSESDADVGALDQEQPGQLALHARSTSGGVRGVRTSPT